MNKIKLEKYLKYLLFAQFELHHASVCKFKLYFLICIAFTLCIPVAPIFADESELILGVFPRRQADDTVRSFTPLAKYLETSLQRKVKLETARNFKAFWKNITSKRYDIVHFNQYHYIQAHSVANYEVFAINEEYGKSSISSIIVTHKQSGIQNLKELQGHSIVFGGNEQAMVSYILPMYVLKKSGINQEDFTSKFSTNPPNAWLAAYYQSADVASVGSPIARMTRQKYKLQPESLIVLARSESIIHLPWAFKGTINHLLKQKIIQTITNLKQTKNGNEILKSMYMTNILPAKNSDFNRVREIVKLVTGKDFN